MEGVLGQTLNDLSLPGVLRELIGQKDIGDQLGPGLFDLLVGLDYQIKGGIIELLFALRADLAPDWLGGYEGELGSDHLGHGDDDDLSESGVHIVALDDRAELGEEVARVCCKRAVDVLGVLQSEGVVGGLIGVVEPLEYLFCL